MTVNVTMTTNHGTIKLALNEEKAPETVKNFVSYIEEGFLDGTIFHRVIKGFMIQGGGFDKEMEQKPTKAPVKNEANNRLENKLGTIAMARTQDPHSATAQFFINTANNEFLNFKAESMQGWGYCVFGEVTEGLDVIQNIENVKTSRVGMHDDVPYEAVEIQSVKVDA